MNLDDKFEQISICVARLISAHIYAHDMANTSYYNQNMGEFIEYLNAREDDLTSALKSLLHTA